MHVHHVLAAWLVAASLACASFGTSVEAALPAYKLNYSQSFCGKAGVKYKKVSDKSQATVYPLSTFAVVSGYILNSLVSLYGDNTHAGPEHGGLPGGYPTTIGLDQSRDPVVAVSTCCSGDSWGNAAQRILVRTASGQEMSAGADWACTVPQEWVDVPEGYVLGGVETTQPSDAPWVHGVRYIFVEKGVLAHASQ